MVVNDWREVTPAFLNQKWQEMQGQRFDMDKVSMPWWWLYMLKLCLLVP